MYFQRILLYLIYHISSCFARTDVALGYRPISYFGFAIGTVYQYGLLRLMVSVVFSDIENVPEYSFDFRALTITLIIFVFTYELVMYLYSRSIKRLSVKSIMLE